MILDGNEPGGHHVANTISQFSNQLADAVERAGSAVVAVLEGGRGGVSGTVWRDGIVVTAEHTIRGDDEVTLVLPSGVEAKASVAGRDPATDVAVLKVREKLKPTDFTDSAAIRTGHIVLAVGRRGKEGLSASFGLVSATGGEWRTRHGGRMDRWFRLDLTPYPGFSGGPLIDVSGQIIGINTSGPRRGVVTIPNATVDRVVETVLRGGQISRGYLGIAVQPVAFPPKGSLKVESDRGLLVITVSQGSPAEQAGLMIGDVIVALNGAAVSSPGDLQRVLDPEGVGKSATFQLVRAGRLSDAEVTIGRRDGGH
jgi:S1-C subfamily serine protease